LDINKAFGITLKKYREKVFLSQEKLANDCELHRTYISLLERGERSPSLKTIFLLAERLNIEPHLLIKEVEKVYFKK